MGWAIMDPKELLNNYIKSRRIISDLFSEEWLTSSGNNELQKLWERTDWIALTEILVFGHCLEKCKSFDEKVTMDLVEKIKISSNRNERRGSIYEILVAGAYYNTGRFVVEFPAKRDNPGYDLKLTQGDINILISIKTHGLFQRTEDFAEKSKEVRSIIKHNIIDGCNSVFIVNDKSYPGILDWYCLQENLPSLLNSRAKKIINGWSIYVNYSPPMSQLQHEYLGIEGHISTKKPSYMLYLNTKIHQNDLETLVQKIDGACENLQKHTKNSKSINIVLVRVPREIDLKSCKLRINDYFINRPQSTISGVFLHQPEFAFGDSKAESLVHCYEFIINPRGSELSNDTINLIPKYIAGLWNQGSRPIMFVTDTSDIISNDIEYYKYSSGHIFYRPIKGNGKRRMINGILWEPDVPPKLDERDTINQMLLPESDELLLL
ncbi:MAG: hypothetical protein WCY97_07675 [Methanothrix sp.]